MSETEVKSFELGPKQKKWLEDLRSGKFEQTEQVLYDGTGYCCLGVACVSLGYEFEIGEDDDPHYYCQGTCEVLPESIKLELKLYDVSGVPNISHKSEERKVYTLSELNDNAKKSFNEIANIIESHPTWYFEGPA